MLIRSIWFVSSPLCRHRMYRFFTSAAQSPPPSQVIDVFDDNVVMPYAQSYHNYRTSAHYKPPKLPQNYTPPQANAAINRRIKLYHGDITSLRIDAIVNAANESLRGGGGIDGAIHRAAGSQLIRSLRERYPDGCNTADAVISEGFHLPANFIIHTVGPTDGDPQTLRRCYDNTMKTAVDNNIRSLAFCCIATGIYGFDNVRAAHIALSSTRRWLEQHLNDKTQTSECPIDLIVFCTFLPVDRSIYEQVAPLYFPITQESTDTDAPQPSSSSSSLTSSSTSSSPSTAAMDTSPETSSETLTTTPLPTETTSEMKIELSNELKNESTNELKSEL